MENDFPIKTGSKTTPNKTCTAIIVSIKKSKVPVGSSSTKANKDNKIIEITDPTIWIKLMAKANKPQNIGKLTSNIRQARVKPTPVNRLIINLTTTNLIRSFSIFIKTLIEECFCLSMVLFNNF